MPEPLEHFKLPREDWYDEAVYDSKGKLIDAGGRLYKDALIENFNAIEQKLLELARISFIDSQVVDVSTIEFPDVTLEDEDNRIIGINFNTALFVNASMQIVALCEGYRKSISLTLKSNNNYEEYIKECLKCAALIKLCQPFNDGNNRTGLVLFVLLLQKRGYVFNLNLALEDMKNHKLTIPVFYDLNDNIESISAFKKYFLNLDKYRKMLKPSNVNYYI